MLQGPEIDAKAFYDWVTTDGGVDATRGHATLILSSQHPKSTKALDAQPTAELLKTEFARLEDLAANAPNGKAGTRLYLYLSGHGFGQDLYTASLLMANATQSRTGNHIPGRAWADHFCARSYFDEVLLFMDCCRERYAPAILNGPGGHDLPVPSTARRFYAYSAKHGRLSVERNIGGQVRGVFTAALLDALRGGAAEDNGEVTNASLEAFLYENVRSYLDPADLADADVATEPELFSDPPATVRPFVIARAKQVLHEVSLPVPVTNGDVVELWGEGSDGKYARLWTATTDGSGAWPLVLPRGTYHLITPAARPLVTVNGRGELDVQQA
jgi:hypothetical protein